MFTDSGSNIPVMEMKQLGTEFQRHKHLDPYYTC